MITVAPCTLQVGRARFHYCSQILTNDHAKTVMLEDIICQALGITSKWINGSCSLSVYIYIYIYSSSSAHVNIAEININIQNIHIELIETFMMKLQCMLVMGIHIV